MGLAALSGVSATTCVNSPYTMDDAKTETYVPVCMRWNGAYYPLTSHHLRPWPTSIRYGSDLNNILTSWSGVACTGTLLFTTTTPKTYDLNSSFVVVATQNMTWDGSASAGVTLVAKAFDRVIRTTDAVPVYGGFVTLTGLTLQGNGNVTSSSAPGATGDGGCALMPGPTLTVTDCVFQHCSGSEIEDGGAIYGFRNP